jgi:hypothetical protein
MLLAQETRNYVSQIPTQRDLPGSHLASTQYNKIALVVEVLSSNMGLGHPSDESEEDFDHRLKIIVSICRANGLYRERHCALRNQGPCQIEMLSHKTDYDGLLVEPDISGLAGHRPNAARILESLYPLRFFISEFDWKQVISHRNVFIAFSISVFGPELLLL